MSKLFKVFAKQAGIRADDVNKYLMKQAVVQVTSTTDLDTVLVKAGVRVAYVTSTNAFYYWNGTAWTSTTQTPEFSGYGYAASNYTTSDYVGTPGTSTMTLGSYFIPFHIEGISELKNWEIYCASVVSGNQKVQTQIYSSQNGRPKSVIGNDTSNSGITTTGFFLLGSGGPTYILKPGLYFVGVSFFSTIKSHTYASITQSSSTGGPQYLSTAVGGDFSSLTLRPRPAYFSATSYGIGGTAWPTSPTVNTVATAPLVRLQWNTATTPTNTESGIYA